MLLDPKNIPSRHISGIQSDRFPKWLYFFRGGNFYNTEFDFGQQKSD